MGWTRVGVDETCHVVWGLRLRNEELYLHAIGDGAEGTRVTQELAKKRFDGSKCRTPWLPVLFPLGAVTENLQSRNCVTAGASAVVRGWSYIG